MALNVTDKKLDRFDLVKYFFLKDQHQSSLSSRRVLPPGADDPLDKVLHSVADYTQKNHFCPTTELPMLLKTGQKAAPTSGFFDKQFFKILELLLSLENKRGQ